MKFQLICCDPAWKFSDRLSMSDTKRGAEANYSVMSNADIAGLDINSLADPDGCVLALWVPSSLLQVGLDTMKAWKFEQKQSYIWVKIKKDPLNKIKKHIVKFMKLASKIKGKESFVLKDYLEGLEGIFSFYKLDEVLSFYMGRLMRQTHEICLIGINNPNIYKKLKNKSQRSVSFAPNLKHSQKPESLQDSLDLMFPDTDDYTLNRLEMFGRRSRDNWKVIGNEAHDTLGEDIRVSIDKLIKE